MNTERIDFISSYCDRWCERCAFTTRCSAYAVEAATAMCDGDFESALELAVGRPRPVDGHPEPAATECLALLEDAEPRQAELDALTHEQRARRQRIEATALSRIAWSYSRHAHRWCAAHDALATSPDSVLREAFDVISWDSAFITVKLHRALDGRDRHVRDGDVEDHPIQNDWNGSAKVALMSVERSESAWRAIGGAAGDAQAVGLADLLVELRAALLQEFPNATSFVRPGFDEE